MSGARLKISALVSLIQRAVRRNSEEITIWVHRENISRNEREIFFRKHTTMRDGAVRHGSYLSGAYVGGEGRLNFVRVVVLGRGAHWWDLHLSHCSIVLTAKSDIWQLWAGMQGKVDPKDSSLSGWTRVSLYKRVRVHNNFKNEDVRPRSMKYIPNIRGNWPEIKMLFLSLETMKADHCYHDLLHKIWSSCIVSD